VSRFQKLFQKLLDGDSDASFAFDELRYVLSHLGFAEDIEGSHHIFTRDGVDELVNIQKPRGGKHAKAYQVRQVRRLIFKYRFSGGEK
jgi:hypothetical protein